MSALVIVIIVVVIVAVIGLALSVRIVKQYEQGVLFRLGRVVGVRQPGLTFIVPLVDVLRRVSLRIVTMPIQSQGIITRDNVSVDVSAVAYYRVVDPVKSEVAIENVAAAIDQIAQTTLRKVVGQHTLDETLSETDRINVSIREILDGQTSEWGVVVTLVELKDIQLPESMKRAMARQAEAEREKRAKIIAAEGESLAADCPRHRLRHHDGPPTGAPAAEPAEPGRARGRQEHHRRLPGAVDEHHRRAGSLPRPGDRRCHLSHISRGGCGGRDPAGRGPGRGRGRQRKPGPGRRAIATRSARGWPAVRSARGRIAERMASPRRMPER